MKPDLGSTDTMKPDVGSRGGRWFQLGFHYVETNTIPLDSRIVTWLGYDTYEYTVIKRASKIAIPSKTMLFADRYTWHKRKDAEVRQLVFADGSANWLAHKEPLQFNTPYMLKGHLFRTAEGVEIVPVEGLHP